MPARWVTLLARPLSPFTSVLIRLGNVIAPGKGLERGPFVTEDDLREMIDTAESDEIIEESERAMIHSIFELADTVVREIMVPRPDMVVVSADAALSEVIDVVLGAGHSRVPVYRDDRDRIVGLVYAKDVLRRLHSGAGENGPWEDLLRPASFVPELKRVDALLRELQTEKVHLAVVVDEYGATAGLVTIEDILEEIVGEIVDEYDREEALVEKLGREPDNAGVRRLAPCGRRNRWVGRSCLTWTRCWRRHGPHSGGPTCRTPVSGSAPRLSLIHISEPTRR